jgi:hypothetical protein
MEGVEHTSVNQAKAMKEQRAIDRLGQAAR